ncbi:MAG: hypothetical protein IMZ50_17160 [Candidatus Atribacteria bacterium]|nr:hypothetical protein [Candidatus Atribacteria bacterium]
MSPRSSPGSSEVVPVPARGTGHRILIVEDQREVSRLLRSTLETLEVELA